MNIIDVIEESLQQIGKLAKTIKADKSIQVRAIEEKEFIRATAFAWFKSHKRDLAGLSGNPAFKAVDSAYSDLLQCGDKATGRNHYIKLSKEIRGALIDLRSAALQMDSSINGTASSVPYPKFGKLISDQKMQTILERRWDEVQICLQNSAPLAAAVMIGALLEALLLGRINVLTDKAPIFKLRATPKDKSGKALPLQAWKLKDLIEVSAEMKWIRQPAKQVSTVIRDYRNFIHPERELSSGINIEKEDTQMFWAIFVQLASQIIGSIS